MLLVEINLIQTPLILLKWTLQLLGGNCLSALILCCANSWEALELCVSFCWGFFFVIWDNTEVENSTSIAYDLGDLVIHFDDDQEYDLF